MTTAEILEEIRRLPIDQQQELKEKLIGDSDSNDRPHEQITQAELDQLLFDEGLLVRLPGEFDDEDDDFEPVEFTSKPISETIIEERR